MWGSIIFTDSVRDIQWGIANHFEIIAMVDDPRPYSDIKDIVPLANLLPPFDAVSAEIDGDKIKAEAIYKTYLHTLEPMASMSAMLLALKANISLMLYLPIDESMAFNFIEVFSSVFFEDFGIQIGSMASGSIMLGDPGHMANIANLMYSLDDISFSEYCCMMPYWMPPSPAVVDKMMRALCYNFPNGMEECIRFCMAYIANQKQQLSASIPVEEKKSRPMFLMDDAMKAGK